MEKLDDVLGYGLKIYQRRDWFCFSLDSVLLANFPKIRKNTKKILDLGTGNGVIPLILSRRSNANILGVDIQQDLIDLATKSVKYNKLEKQILLKCMNMKELLNEKNLYNSFDLILSNPPFFSNYDNSLKNDNVHKAIARHELFIKLEEIFFIASRLLKEGGKFALIHRADKFIDIITLFRKNDMEPKLVTFIYKNCNSESYMVYVEGIKHGKTGLKVTKPFILYLTDGSMTKDYEKLCNEVML